MKRKATIKPAARRAETPISIDLSNLPACVEDVRRAALDSDSGPADPTSYSALRGRLEASREKLPPLYREVVFQPYARALERLGAAGFASVLASDPERISGAGLMLDVAQAILQNGEGYQERPTDAFQEVVSDLYDGFLSAEDRRGVERPDHGTVPPLVKWGNPDSGPYTWPVDATEVLGVGAGVVSLPPSHARRGLFAWGALGHETAGHDVLGADTGLRGELEDAVRNALLDSNVGEDLAEYWAERIDETASDVLGILNMGPGAALGLLGYFRGLSAAFEGRAKLRSDGPADDSHPADVLRGYLAASTVRLLRFDRAAAWGKILEAETDKDVGSIVLAGAEVGAETARRSAAAVAEAIVKTRARSLEHRSLGRIQNWRNRDEEIVAELRTVLAGPGEPPSEVEAGFYAAHAVTAALTAAASTGGDIRRLHERLVLVLKGMHDRNPSWGPLFVRRPGDLRPRFAYGRIRARERELARV
ncbi:MAG TPA: hypothetical protein VFI25_03935 [Planctomycetota bacterium]|jgi:hypothetical protein|nr:hypothetical protein [Planctomycetota bacterium]